MKHQLIQNLTSIKAQTTATGYEYINSILPVPLGEMNKHLEPFVIIERACDKAIKLLQDAE